MDSFHERNEGPHTKGDAAVVHARLLGAFSLTGPFAAHLAGAGRKVRAILAYLVLANGRPVPRQELMAFAWSDRPVAQGRASLRQALHEARRLFGAESPLLIADRNAVQIAVKRVNTDLGLILAHARADRVTELAQALRQSPGLLLADLDGIDTNIDSWLANERRRWTEDLRAEVGAAVSRASAAGDAADIGPLTVLLDGLALPTAGDAARQQPAPKAGRPRAAIVRWRWPILVCGMAIVAAIALAVGIGLRSSPSDILVVEPLQTPTADPAAQLVRSGLAGDIAQVMVGRPAGLSIIQADDPHPGFRRAQLTLTGNATTIGDLLRVHVQLANNRTQAILWSRNFVEPPAEADTLREQVATKLGSVLNCAMSTRHRGAKPVSDQSSILYLKACDLIGDYDLEPALDLLRQVTVQAPGFARAWADVAVTRAMSVGGLSDAQRATAYAEADRAAYRALQIDPQTGLAYYALAQTQRGLANWSKRTAIIAKGLQVEPDSSELNNAMGEELLRVGRAREGVEYLKRSIRFDPLNPVKTAPLIPMLAFYGDLDGAEALAAKARKLWPGNAMIWDAIFKMEADAGDPRKALAMLQDPNRQGLRAPDDGRAWSTMLRARIDPTPANIDAAIRERTGPAGQTASGDPLPAALTFSRLGRTDLAYRTLTSPAVVDEAVNEDLFRDGQTAFRADPRFMPLAARRGLVAIWRATNHWPDFCAAGPKPRDCRAEAAKAF